ncbi:3-ketoacyl-acyl carrier protein reductase, putative [Metarhizium acridum CQMa 102]|uniref:Hydroxynaphthalene reductase-like protein Arp2 n=1 Tax=Metarhizium acridum (strain CQMa 102) TaxID=655827 RepID=E9EHJ9_METAQ|nr:3-ketoacyl-acyl carrier protein reductase, putative [Metarhizium acridum CQMa 102]EFY84598.1 3-ketoacyl-acyl carrier protein reductase, putative [Metarhizium acridum CQMa 102]
MTVYHLQSVDNDLRGRLALVTGSRSWPSRQWWYRFGVCKDIGVRRLRCCASLLCKQIFVTAQADLTDRESTRSLVSRILSNPVVSEKHKAISVLVANAGLGRRIRDVKDIGEQDWDEMMEVNIRSQFVVTKSCVEGMRAQEWGRVILVGSIASRGSGLNGCHYAASKGALSSMGLNLATLLAPDGVTVNVVSPAMIGSTGMIPTPKERTWVSGVNVEALKESDPGLAIASSVPVHRLGAPEEVANVVAM